MNHGVRWTGVFWKPVFRHVEQGGDSVECLAGIGEISLQSIHRFSFGYMIFGEIDQIEVENLVALIKEVWDAMAACFATSSCEDDAFSC